MEKEKLGLEPEFPMPTDNSDLRRYGINKRFYAACAAMQGLLSNPNSAYQMNATLRRQPTSEEAVSMIVNQSFIIADELLTKEEESHQK